MRLVSSFYFLRAGRLQKPENSEELEPVDDLPPVTVITGTQVRNDGKLVVSGVATDDGDIKQVLVNG